jgi:hypothetical protein
MAESRRKRQNPAATIQVAAGAPHGCPPGVRVSKASKPGRGSPGVREMAGTGREQPARHSANAGVGLGCDAKCDAISADRVELLARAVLLVAGMAIPGAARAAVLA